jgi:CheY-like chemotaxis protein
LVSFKNKDAKHQCDQIVHVLLFPDSGSEAKALTPGAMGLDSLSPFFIMANGGAIARIEDDSMTTRNGSVRILVADDNDLMRRALCSLLQSRAGWTICGEAKDGTDAVEKAIQLKPDVILVDLSLPHLNGFEVAKSIHRQMPDSKILVVTEQESRLLARLPCQPGVHGYVVKSRIGLDLTSAVEAASSHQFPAQTGDERLAC